MPYHEPIVVVVGLLVAVLMLRQLLARLKKMVTLKALIALLEAMK